MNHNFNSRLLRRLMCLSLMMASMLIHVSYGMKRAGQDNQSIENDAKQYPLHQQMINLGRNHEGITCTSISPDGRFLAVGDEGGHIQIWNMFTGALISECETGTELCVLSLKWLRNGHYLVASIKGFFDRGHGDETVTDDDASGYPFIVFLKVTDHGSFDHDKLVSHCSIIKEHPVIDFVCTDDATSLITVDSCCVKNKIFNQADNFKVHEIKKSQEYDQDLNAAKVCISGDEQYCLCAFSGLVKLTIGFIQLQDMNHVGRFQVSGKLLDCDLSAQNNVLLLTRRTNLFDTTTTAMCYTIGADLKLLFQLDHKNCDLEKLYYSSDSAFIIGYANQQVEDGWFNVNAQNSPATVFVWDCYGRPLRKITIDDTNVHGKCIIYDAKMVGSILTFVFADNQRMWSISCNLAHTHKCIMNGQFGIKPSIQDIQFQDLLLCIDQEGELSVNKLD